MVVRTKQTRKIRSTPSNEKADHHGDVDNEMSKMQNKKRQVDDEILTIISQSRSDFYEFANYRTLTGFLATRRERAYWQIVTEEQRNKMKNQTPNSTLSATASPTGSAQQDLGKVRLARPKYGSEQVETGMQVLDDGVQIIHHQMQEMIYLYPSFVCTTSISGYFALLHFWVSLCHCCDRSRREVFPHWWRTYRIS